MAKASLPSRGATLVCNQLTWNHIKVAYAFVISRINSGCLQLLLSLTGLGAFGVASSWEALGAAPCLGRSMAGSGAPGAERVWKSSCEVWECSITKGRAFGSALSITAVLLVLYGDVGTLGVLAKHQAPPMWEECG